MATSGSTDFSLNTTQIIRKACTLINAVPVGQAVPGRYYEEILSSLNLMVKSWMAKGRFLWAWSEKSGVTIVADQQSYTIGPSGADITMEKPMQITSVRLRETATNIDLPPLKQILRAEYQNGILAKTSDNAPGIPTKYYYDPQRATGTLYLHNVPDTSTASDYTLRFDYPRRIEDFDAANDDPDFIQEYLETLIYNLAVRIRPIFPAIKVEDISDVIAIAQGLYDAMEVWTGEPDENLCFEPDRPFDDY
jgi:hypothetical protein